MKKDSKDNCRDTGALLVGMIKANSPKKVFSTAKSERMIVK